MDKDIKTDKINNYKFLGSESHELNENNKLFNFCSKLKKGDRTERFQANGLAFYNPRQNKQLFYNQAHVKLKLQLITW